MASTNKTENIQLNQWIKTDPVLMDDMNADNQKLDSAIGALQSGMLHIASGSYEGTGTCGSGSPTSLSFDFSPRLLIIRAPSSEGKNGNAFGTTLVRGIDFQYNDTYGMYSSYMNVSWGENSVSWYTNMGYPGDQLNESGTTYYYVAIG